MNNWRSWIRPSCCCRNQWCQTRVLSMMTITSIGELLLSMVTKPNFATMQCILDGLANKYSKCCGLFITRFITMMFSIVWNEKKNYEGTLVKNCIQQHTSYLSQTPQTFSMEKTFVTKSVLLQFTLFCCETCFVAIYALSMWRKIEPTILSVEKKLQISRMYKITLLFLRPL